MKRLLALALITTLATPITASAQAKKVVQIPQDGDFGSYNLRWNGAIGGGYDAQVALKNFNGKLAFCGVGIVTNSQLNSAIKTGLRGGTIKINGKTILKDFSFFAKAKSKSALKKTPANCAVTSAPIPSRLDDLSIRYGKATFRN